MNADGPARNALPAEGGMERRHERREPHREEPGESQRRRSARRFKKNTLPTPGDPISTPRPRATIRAG